MPQDAEDSLRDPLLYYGYNQDTISDRLNEQNISWRIYHGDIPQSMVLEHQWTPRNATHYEFMGVFFTDVQLGRHFPAFSFIEPSYYPPGQNDDPGPAAHDRACEGASRAVSTTRCDVTMTYWQSTLLVVVYDEHGGFSGQRFRRRMRYVLTIINPQRGLRSTGSVSVFLPCWFRHGSDRP